MKISEQTLKDMIRNISQVERKTFKARSTEITLPVSFSATKISELQRLWSTHVRGLGSIAKD